MSTRALLLIVVLGSTGCSLCSVRPPEYDPVQLPSGLVVRDLAVPENGVQVTGGDTVAIHYDLWLEDRTLVDSSRSTGIPLRFQVGTGAVPPGLDEGVLGMRLFGRRRLELPCDLAFGSGGRPPRVPPDSAVVLEIELMEHLPARP